MADDSRKKKILIGMASFFFLKQGSHLEIVVSKAKKNRA